MDTPEKKVKINKTNLALIIIAILIVALVVVIIVGNSKNHKNDSIATTTTTTVAQTESTTSVSDEKYAVDGNHLDMPKEDRGLYTGVAKAVIKSVSSKPQFYYFNCGTFDKTYTGLAGSLTLKDGMPVCDYYVKNGIAQTKFTGVVSFEHYLRVIKNGIYQDDYNGKVSLDGLEADCENGAVLGYELGREDGFIPPYKVTILG